MASIKIVKVMTSDYTLERVAQTLLDYGVKCVNEGWVSDLFPYTTLFRSVYTDGNDALDALEYAIEYHKKIPLPVNLKIVKDKMALVIKWLRVYTSKVEPIANDDANRTTRQEAYTNILLSGLKPQKLLRSDKGNPETAVITASYIGKGIIEVIITNGKDFDPSSITIIAIEVSPITEPATKKPVVKIIDGQVSVTSKVAVRVVVKTITGKRKSLKLTQMNTHPSFNVCVFCQNGNDQISDLSNVVLVELIDPA